MTRFSTGSPAEEVSGGDPEDLEENGNEGGADLPDLAEPAVGAHHQPRSLHGGQVVLRGWIWATSHIFRDNGDFDFKWGAGDIISDSHAPDPARPPIK